MRLFVTLLTAFSLLNCSSSTTPPTACFLPQIEMQIPESLDGISGIDKKTFNSLIDRVEKIYAPIVASHGATLKINRLWSNATVNSNATQDGTTWIVNAYGGLARYPAINADGELLVLCHEMGHHLGNFPKYPDADWAANEGQADYFANMKCFRRVVKDDDNITIVSKMMIPDLVKTNCALAFKSAEEQAVCQRGAMAGKNLGLVLYELSRGGASSNAPDFGTPDTSQVSTTNDNHPEAQCRLDTYFAGSICGASYEIDFGLTDGVQGACSQEAHDKYGYRPRCWYKPKK